MSFDAVQIDILDREGERAVNEPVSEEKVVEPGRSTRGSAEAWERI